MEEKNELDKRVEAVQRLLELFKFERMVYLIITILSIIVLIAIATFLLVTENFDDPKLILSMFGPTGGIAYSTGRLLKMWSDAIKMLYQIEEE